MKQLFILALLGVWMFSCNEATQSKSDSAAVDTPTKDTVLPVSPDTVAKIIDTVTATPAEPTYRVGFRILFTSTYCGGARPSDEMLAEKATPKLLYNSTLKFKNHFSGKEYFLKTSPDGEASADMEEGKYDVYLTKDINSALSTGFDPKCSLWMNELLVTVKVAKGVSMQDVTIHFDCNPCDSKMKQRP